MSISTQKTSRAGRAIVASARPARHNQANERGGRGKACRALCVAHFSCSSVAILRLIIGLTIFRRWRAVHGAEEQPSPGGFAMVVQKASFTTAKGSSNGSQPKGAANAANANAKKPSPMTIYDDSGGFEASVIANNMRNGVALRGCPPTSTSMVIILMAVYCDGG